MYGWPSENMEVNQHDLEAMTFAILLQDECGWTFVDWRVPA